MSGAFFLSEDLARDLVSVAPVHDMTSVRISIIRASIWIRIAVATSLPDTQLRAKATVGCPYNLALHQMGSALEQRMQSDDDDEWLHALA